MGGMCEKWLQMGTKMRFWGSLVPTRGQILLERNRISLGGLRTN